MKTTPYAAIAALAVASTLSAYASSPLAGATEPEYVRLAQVHPGLTKEDVLRIAGRPGIKTGAASGGELWIYTAHDVWNEETEYDITFDAKGVVTDKTALRDN